MAHRVKSGVVALVLLAATGLPGCAHSPPPPPPRMHPGGPPGPECAHPEGAAPAPSPLPGLVDAMNAAQGPAKVDAMAAVVNELANEHMKMHERMRMVHEHMQGMQCDEHPN